LNITAEKDDGNQPNELSIIIVNFNTRRLLKCCLQSIYDTARDLRFEVFVVDNASSDGSAEMIRTHFPRVRLIENYKDAGFTKAANLALVQAIGRYCLVSHPDIEFTSGSIQNMINFLNAHDEVGVVGANCLYPDGSYVESPIKGLSIAREIVEFGCDSLDRISRKLPRGPDFLEKLRSRYFWDHLNFSESEVVYFTCMMFRKQLIKAIGYFSEHFFIWFADYDWCQRVLNSGWKVCWFPKSKVIHYEKYSQRFIDDERVRYKTDWSLVHHLQSADKFTLIRKYHSQRFLWLAIILEKLSLCRTRLRRSLFAVPYFQSDKRNYHYQFKKKVSRRFRKLFG
jgi:GT2 family glycosyltransferase